MLSQLHLAVDRIQDCCVWTVNSSDYTRVVQIVLVLQSGWMMLSVIHVSVVDVCSELIFVILHAG